MLHLWNHSHTKSVIRIYKVHIEFHSKDYTSISVSSTSNLAYNLLVASIESSSNLLSSSFSDRHLTSYNFVYSSLPISLYRLYLRLQTRFRSWILNFSLGWKTTFFFFSFCEKISKIRILNILTFIDQFIPWKSKLFLLYRKWIKKKGWETLYFRSKQRFSIHSWEAQREDGILRRRNPTFRINYSIG